MFNLQDYRNIFFTIQFAQMEFNSVKMKPSPAADGFE